MMQEYLRFILVENAGCNIENQFMNVSNGLHLIEDKVIHNIFNATAMFLNVNNSIKTKKARKE
jgi:hypothetical protein